MLRAPDGYRSDCRGCRLPAECALSATWAIRGQALSAEPALLGESGLSAEPALSGESGLLGCTGAGAGTLSGFGLTVGGGAGESALVALCADAADTADGADAADTADAADCAEVAECAEDCDAGELALGAGGRDSEPSRPTGSAG